MQEQVSTGTAGSQRVSSLREAILAQMTEKGLAEATRDAYVNGVLGLVRHYGGRKPEAISVAEARAYVAGLKAGGASATFRPHASAGIRFLYETTLGQPWRSISPLRRRMMEDMELRGFTAKTQFS
jgi:hypothetical protein